METKTRRKQDKVRKQDSIIIKTGQKKQERKRSRKYSIVTRISKRNCVTVDGLVGGV